MGEMRIRIGADDIERIALGSNPDGLARLEFRNAVLSAYAEAHIKPLENSEEIKKLKALLSAELNVALEKYITSNRASFGRYELKPEIKKAIQEAASSVFEQRLADIITESRNRIDAIGEEMRVRVKALEQRVEQHLAGFGENKDAETFVYDAFTKVLNAHLNNFIKGRTLGEMEALADQRLKEEKRSMKRK